MRQSWCAAVGIAVLVLLPSCAPEPATTPTPTATGSPSPRPTPSATPSGTPDATPTPPGGATPTPAPTACATDWTIDRKTDLEASGNPIINVRAGRHECYDRLVIDITGAQAGYDVRYVDEVVGEGSGEPVPLRGSAFLSITVVAPAYDPETGEGTYEPADPKEAVDVTSFPVFRQVAVAGSYEGRTSFGLGVSDELPFEVVVLPGPGTGSRVVIDVAHER